MHSALSAEIIFYAVPGIINLHLTAAASLSLINSTEADHNHNHSE